MRYIRQDKFFKKNISKNFSKKNIVVVGCGGVGSVLAELLLRGGFTNLTLIDNDIVDLTNLQRQIYTEKNLGENKSKALLKRLISINRDAKIKSISKILDEKNIESICFSFDLIVDCTDNFKTRKLINGFCEMNKKNWLYTGAVKSKFSLCLFLGKEKKFKKIFPKKIKDTSCCEVGVLSSTTFACASFAYNEILKYFLKEKLSGFVFFDLWRGKLEKFGV